MKTLLAIISITAAVFSGCKSTPTPAQLETASYAIGSSTALVCNMTKISNEDRQIIINIVGEIKYCTPTNGQSLAEAWSGIAKVHIAKLVEEKKIDEAEGKIIYDAFNVVVEAADYMIRVRWPKIGEDADCIFAVTNGFCDGFLTFFKPVDMFSASARNAAYDQDAYDYLVSRKTK